MSSTVHIDNKNEDILILGEGTMQWLDDTTLTAEAIYPINFTHANKRFVLTLHYNESCSFLFVNTAKIYQFKAKNSEIKDYAMYLGNFSKDFTSNNMKKKTVLKRFVNFFSVDFNPIDTNNILDIHKYFMKRIWYRIRLGLIKKILIGLLTDLVNECNYTKCMSLSNQKCMTQPTLINLYFNEYSQEFHCYPFAVKLSRCVESCITLNDLSNEACIPNKTKI